MVNAVDISVKKYARIYQTQARILPVLCALHNFMCIADTEEEGLPESAAADNGVNPLDGAENSPEVNIVFGIQEAQEIKILRDSIATRMWEDYQVVVAQRLGQSQEEEILEILSSIEEEE